MAPPEMAVTQAELKIECRGKANVYIYQFDWATPLYGGKLGGISHGRRCRLPCASCCIRKPTNYLANR